MSTIDLEVLKTVFDESIAAGLEAPAIQRLFIVEHDVAPAAAIGIYAKFARAAGLTLSNEERKAKAAEIFAEADLTTEDGLVELNAALCKGLDIAPVTAAERIRVYAKENGIQLPGAGSGGFRESIASKEDVVAFLVAHRGEERKVLREGLIDLGYKKSTSDSLLAMIPYMEEYVTQLGEADAA